ncbi:SMI1/KNR4 family protein [Paenibacillus sp. FSL R10-2734]|uniref:SMI1/KNR4 family protein n=1 Tax=Paenibacillus sp. FSL R10-2734 TaxID=2954691 RepID=UPI0030D821AD
MSDELLAKLDTWHEEDEFQEIVDAITEIPEEERDYELTSHLGRAFNNLGQYEEGLEQFLSIEEEGEDDPLWHYRIGVSYYYLKRYEDALKAFTAADELEPDDEDTLEFLGWIRRKLAKRTAKKPMNKPVKKPVMAFDFSEFWDDSEYALEEYVSDPPTDEMVASVQEELVFKLPAFYVDMMRLHNGGIPHNNRYTHSETGEAITISGILSIGREKNKSLCGASGSRFMIENGGYPEVGVVICDCPSENEVIMLDYREFGNDGEPEVIHVDRDNKYKITRLADSFETFIRGLTN